MNDKNINNVLVTGIQFTFNGNTDKNAVKRVLTILNEFGLNANENDQCHISCVHNGEFHQKTEVWETLNTKHITIGTLCKTIGMAGVPTLYRNDILVKFENKEALLYRATYNATEIIKNVFRKVENAEVKAAPRADINTTIIRERLKKLFGVMSVKKILTTTEKED